MFDPRKTRLRLTVGSLRHPKKQLYIKSVVDVQPSASNSAVKRGSTHIVDRIDIPSSNYLLHVNQAGKPILSPTVAQDVFPFLSKPTTHQKNNPSISCKRRILETFHRKENSPSHDIIIPIHPSRRQRQNSLVAGQRIPTRARTWKVQRNKFFFQPPFEDIPALNTPNRRSRNVLCMP